MALKRLWRSASDSLFFFDLFGWFAIETPLDNWPINPLTLGVSFRRPDSAIPSDEEGVPSHCVGYLQIDGAAYHRTKFKAESRQSVARKSRVTSWGDRACKIESSERHIITNVPFWIAIIDWSLMANCLHIGEFVPTALIGDGEW
jgi:hypothetical protein